MTEPLSEDEYDDEDTTQRGATAYAGTGTGAPTGPVGAGGGPTIRAVTLGALSVPVPKHVEIQPLPKDAPARFPWPAILLGVVLGVAVTILGGLAALHMMGLIRLY